MRYTLLVQEPALVIEQVPSSAHARPAGKAFVANKRVSFLSEQHCMEVDLNKTVEEQHEGGVLEIGCNPDDKMAVNETTPAKISTPVGKEFPPPSDQDDDDVLAKWISMAGQSQADPGCHWDRTQSYLQALWVRMYKPETASIAL